MSTWLDRGLFGTALRFLSRGSAVSNRPSVNFAAPLIATDNSGANRTDVSIVGVATGPGASTVADEVPTFDGTDGLTLSRGPVLHVDDGGGNATVTPRTVESSLTLTGSGTGTTLGGDGAAVESLEDFKAPTVVVKPTGVVGSGAVNDQPALQAAIDRAYSLSGPGHTTRVVLPPGEYRIDSPLYFMSDAGGNDISFAGGVELVCESSPFLAGGRSARIISTSVDLPAIIIQGARGVAIRRLRITGPAVWTYDGTRLYDDHIDDALYTGALNDVAHGCRDNAYSPQTGLAVDPFMNGNPGGNAANKYPGLSARYTTVGTIRKSSSIVIEECIFENHVVGAVVSPTGDTGNAENITFIGCAFWTSTDAIAWCQTQTRGNTMVGCSVADAKHAISTRRNPDAAGASPRIFGLSVGGCRHVFDVSLGPGDFHVSGLYVESSLSLGRIGTNNNSANSPATIDGGSISLWSSATTAAARDLGAHLVTGGPVRFSGVLFAPSYNIDGTQEVWHFYNPAGTITFDSCKMAAEFSTPGIAAGKTGQLLITFYDESRVAMHECQLIDSTVAGGIQTLSEDVVATTAAEVDRVRLWGRLRVDTAAQKAATSLTPGTYVQAIPRWQVLSWGSCTVSASGANEATFTPADASLVRPGDPVFKATQNVPIDIEPQDGTLGESELYGTFVGVVETVIAGVVTLYRLPKNLALPFTDTLYTKQVPRYHKASTGNITGGASYDITGVTNPTTWAVGDRIQDVGGTIPPGVYVTNVVTTTVTVSKALSTAVTGAILYDAPVKTFCAIASDYFGVGAGSESAMVAEQLRVNKAALATTPSGGIHLTNPTASTGGATQQVSPPLTWVGTAWDANDSVTRYVRQEAYIAPQTSNTPYPIFTLRESTDVGTPSWTIRHEFIGGTAPEYHMSGLRVLAYDGANLYVGGSGISGAEYLWAGSIVFFPGSTDVGGLSTLGLTSKKALFNTGAISPAALASGTTNNYSPTGLATCSTMYITADVAGSALSGLAAQPNGFELDIYVDGTGVLTLKNLDGGSTASSQFTCPGGVDYVVAKPGGVHLKYRAGSVNKWLVRA